jgi:putative transposase
MRASYKYKIYQSKRNKKADQLFSTACWVYNHCIALHKRYYSLYHKSLKTNTLQKHLVKLKKKDRYSSWRTLSSQSIQQITQKIEKGYKMFFQKQAKRAPGFRGRHKYKSITFKDSGWCLNGNEFIINSIGLRLRFFKSRDIAGNIKTVTLKKDAAGDLWLCFSLDDVKSDPKIIPMTGRTAGFDFGLKTFLTCSDGDRVESPQVLLKSLATLRKRSKLVSKKVKGSAGRKKAKLSLARLHRSVSNQRDDFAWKLATDLLQKYDVLCFEDLNMKGMQMMWGRKISDLGFAGFMNKIEYLALNKGKTVVRIDGLLASSKTCYTCGVKYKELGLAERVWTCAGCGQLHDRDLNASLNIKRAGTSALEVELIRPALAG